MFKFLTIAIAVYVLYKITFPSKSLKGSSKDQIKEDSETIDIDYEELE